MFVKILRIREIEVAPIGAPLRVQWIIMRILYVQQVEQKGTDDFALGVTSRAVEIGILLDDLSDVEIQCMQKTGKGIVDIAAILEGQFFILRLELFQTCLQFLAF